MIQHQFWITKKTVQRKLGSKEDEHIISSDAELDAKIEVFKSLAETSTELIKIIDQYQERLCILSQEESVFGRFLKEAGKRSKTTGQSISNTGKSVSYCGQQRMCVRVPLLRLQHEVDIFRYRAVNDTQTTITAMEKERTEYRAALEWMKSTSNELDPDTGRGVDKFKSIQSHVRAAKQNFDTLSMDSIQKIDLLAAARCNMFSHVLVSYMMELKQFAQKTTATFDTISKALELKPKYDFCVLKELTQHEGTQEEVDNTNVLSLDNDQALFFASDYADNNEEHRPTEKIQTTSGERVQNNVPLIALSNNDHDMDTCGTEISNIVAALQTSSFNENDYPISSVFGNNSLSSQKMRSPTKMCTTSNFAHGEQNRDKSLKQNSWIDLFSELDPFANLEAFDMKLIDSCQSSQQT